MPQNTKAIGRPRTRQLDPNQLVHIGAKVRVHQRDEIHALLGPGGVSKLIRETVAKTLRDAS